MKVGLYLTDDGKRDTSVQGQAPALHTDGGNKVGTKDQSTIERKKVALRMTF